MQTENNKQLEKDLEVPEVVNLNPEGVRPDIAEWIESDEVYANTDIAERLLGDDDVCKPDDIAKKVESELKFVIRPMCFSPPIHVASIVATILKDRRIGMAGLSAEKIPHLVEAINAAVTKAL